MICGRKSKAYRRKSKTFVASWRRIARIAASLLRRTDTTSPNPRACGDPAVKNRGGQTRHPPARLEMVDLPDHIEPHRDEQCRQCGCSLEAVEASEIRRRQVFDIPPLMLEVTEHRAETLGCPGCGCQNEAAFPAAVKTSAQYGSHIKSLLV